MMEPAANREEAPALPQGTPTPRCELLLGRTAVRGLPLAAGYAYDRPVVVTVSHGVYSAAGAQVLEVAALQLMMRGGALACRVHLFEASATDRFVEIKHLLAATQGEQGQQWLTPREAAAGLQSLNQCLMARASLLAAARQPDIYAFNAGRRSPEPIHLLVIAGLEALALHDLALTSVVQHLALQGPRCGLLVLLLHDLRAAREAPLSASHLKGLYDMLGAVAPGALGLDFSGAATAPYNLGEPYQRFAANFGYVPELPAGFARACTDEILTAETRQPAAHSQQDFLRIHIGEARATPAFFALGHASYAFNGLISGGSGSGKTTFVQNLLLSICEHYTPEQIELSLLDYGTVSFGPYRGVAHVQTVFDTPRDGERLARLFTAFADELHRRKDLFKACGEAHNVTVDNLASYSARSGEALPNCVLVIDEFGSLMNNENTAMATVNGRTMRVNAYAEQIINVLVREGRKVGMHLLLITQSFAKLDRMPQDIKSNPHLAVGLKAQEARDSTALFNSENDAAVRIAPFQAVLNRHAGEPSRNLVVDLLYVSEAKIADRQAAIRARWPRLEPSQLEEALNSLGRPLPTHTKVHVQPSSEPSWLRPDGSKSRSGA